MIHCQAFVTRYFIRIRTNSIVRLLMVVLVVVSATSCEVYKRRYCDGFYFAKRSSSNVRVDRRVAETIAKSDVNPAVLFARSKEKRMDDRKGPFLVADASSQILPVESTGGHGHMSKKQLHDQRPPRKKQVSGSALSEEKCESCGKIESLKCLVGTYLALFCLAMVITGIVFILTYGSLGVELLMLGIPMVLFGLAGVIKFSTWC